jgi:DNA polymerase-1
MSKFILDIETDGLLDTVTKAWIVGVKDKDTKVIKWWLDGDLGWQDYINRPGNLIIGHNVLGFDIPCLEKLFGFKLHKEVVVHDTMIFSQILNYKRFGNDGHSLEEWGKALNFHKGDFKDFSQYSEEMLEYWKQDLEVTERVYNTVLNEFKHAATKDERIRVYMKAEHAAAKWCAQAELHGWPFNYDKAVELMKLIEIELNKTREILVPLLGIKTVAVDLAKGVVEPKVPKWTKVGLYNAHVANWFNINPLSGQDEDRLVEGPYSRVLFEPLDLESVDDVKIFLYRNGWQPTMFNYKKDKTTGEYLKDKNGEKIKSSAKVTEDSLEFLEGNGKIYCDFLTNKSRYSLVKGLVEAYKNGRVHGKCFTIGTPSMRARHNIIVNIPAADSVWGPEMRALFTCAPGWKLIGCDSAGNQARGLAHYLKSPEYIDKLLHDDIHQYNADVLTRVLKEMGIIHTVPRARAKRILYAFLFGAAGGKMWSYIFDTVDDTKGKKLKAGFTKAVPGFKALMDALQKIYGSTSQYSSGYIPGIAGNKIYVDSFHKLLVYLLQACEKATCCAALMLTMERLEDANIPYQPLIFYHDEIDFMVPEEFAEQAAAIGKQAFIDGPKLLGINIMDGSGKIGNTWYDVH